MQADKRCPMLPDVIVKSVGWGEGGGGGEVMPRYKRGGVISEKLLRDLGLFFDRVCC